MPNEQYVISRELLNEAISGLKAFGQSATQETVYKLSTLPPIGYEKFRVGTKVLVTRRDNPSDSPHHTFAGTIEAIHSFGPTVNDRAGNAWNVNWDQISTLNPTPEEIAVQRIKDAFAKLDNDTVKAIFGENFVDLCG